MIGNDIHVIPIGDLRDHSENEACWCKPEIKDEDVGGSIIVHNSMDRREHTIERGIIH